MKTLIAASHGTDNIGGAKSISDLVKKVADEFRKSEGTLGSVQVLEAFVDVQQPDVTAALEVALGTPAEDSVVDTVVVPLLLATGYHVRQDIADAAFAADSQPGLQGRMQISPALGPDERLVEVLIQRLNEAGATAKTAAEDLVILVVAGSSDARAQAESELVQMMFDEALTQRNGTPTKSILTFLSAAEPKLKDVIPKLKFQNPRKRVVVATYLLADGYFAGLTKKVGAHVVSEPLLLSPAAVEAGLGSTEPPQQLVDIIIDRFTAAIEDGKTTGCLSGLRGELFVGCAAGCQISCR